MIYILRHGEAEPDTGAGDAARRLTEKGERQAREAGRAIDALGLRIETCLSSPKVRALDTARLACEPLGLDIEVARSVADGSFDAVELATGRGDTMIVGHQPYLGMEIARLTGAEVKLKKGGLAILEPGKLHALLRPKELAAIGR